jgi:molybdopterin molybdotransferase
VAVLATGSELVKPGKEVVEGQVYEANTFMLKAVLNSIGIEPQVTLLQDDLIETKNAIKNALQNFDVLILSGGISVGDYDFVKESLEENEVNQLFYKVKQKPGKPLYFGKKQNKLVFALPGNPGAALNCFYLYVLPALNIATGHPKPFLEQIQLPIGQPFKKKTGRANFLKAYSDGKTVNLLDGQGSDVLLSFSQSDCLVYLPEERESVQANELVDVILLP